MIVRPTADEDLVKSVIFDDNIWDSITSDLAPRKEDWFLDTTKNYLVGFVDEKPMGVFVFYPNTDVSLWVHVQVLPEYRKDYAFTFGQKCIEIVTPLASKLCAQIPTKYQNVIAFAQKSGFEIEGLNKASHLKNGELIDQVYLGMRL